MAIKLEINLGKRIALYSKKNSGRFPQNNKSGKNVMFCKVPINALNKCFWVEDCFVQRKLTRDMTCIICKLPNYSKTPTKSQTEKGDFLSVCQLFIFQIAFLIKAWERFDNIPRLKDTRSSWLNCALRGDEAVYWVSTGQQWLELSGTGSL